MKEYYMLQKKIRSFFRQIAGGIRNMNSQKFLSKIIVEKPSAAYPTFLKESVHHIKHLLQIEDFSLRYANDEWICRLQGLEFALNSAEELLILQEVFIEGDYNVAIHQPFTFIDIGMNVGISSLFFANQAECKQVIAFEPFKPTLACAGKNIERNAVASKIQVNEVGLGFPARTLKIAYSEAFKGTVGIHGVPSHIGKVAELQEEQLVIIDVYEALKDIVDDHIIVKIDCEGSEYEIMERLQETGLLTRFDVFMIEWHVKGPAALQTILHRNGFKTLSMGEHQAQAGMLYGFRNF